MQERASGWMADFGEGLPYDAVLHSEEGAAAFHNRYAKEWAEVNRKAGHGDEIAFFGRSGFNKSPGKSTLFWFGDQLVAWPPPECPKDHTRRRGRLLALLGVPPRGHPVPHL